MILVSGATGLLGIHLLMELCQKDDIPIKAMYRTETKKNEAKHVFLNYNPYADATTKWHQIIWVKADITNIPSLEIAFKNITQVYHCAGYVTFNRKKFELLKKTNIEGTANMVNMSLSNSISKFCHVSSIATLNKVPSETVFNEKSPWNTESENSGYAISKFGGEMEVWRGIQEGLNAVIVNPGVIIGSGFFNKGSSKIFSSVNKGIPFYTPGSTGYISVVDCVEIMHQLMSKNIFKERFVLIAKNTSHKNVIDKIGAYLQTKTPKKQIGKVCLLLIGKTEYIMSCISKYKPSIHLDVINSLYENSEYDNTKIKNTLNWRFEEFNDTLKTVSLNYQSSLNDSPSSALRS